MLHEERKLLIRKLFWSFLAVIGCIVCVKAFYELWELTVFFIGIELFIILFFICALSLSCKTYTYKDYEIIVYAGWFHHYIKVNKEIVDEHNTLISYVPITLETTLDSEEKIFARISTFNRISLKINDKLYH